MNEDVIPQHHKKERGEEMTIERKEGKAWRRDEWKEGGKKEGKKGGKERKNRNVVIFFVKNTK